MKEQSLASVRETAVKALAAALERAAAASGAHNRQECHDQLEERRLIAEQLMFAPSEAAKRVLINQVERFNHGLLNQQMAAHVLLERLTAGDGQALLQAEEMIAALNEVMS